MNLLESFSDPMYPDFLLPKSAAVFVRNTRQLRNTRLKQEDAVTDGARPNVIPESTARHRSKSTFAVIWAKSKALQNPRARLYMTIVSWAERLNVKYSKFGNPAVYDNSVFPWVGAVECEWRTIRRELDRVLIRKDDLQSFHDVLPDLDGRITQDRNWKTFMFVGYGRLFKENIRMCPETWRVLTKIPGLKTAMFSIFEPGNQLRAHRGPYNGVLRLHLGLMVPEPREQAAIRIGTKVCHWHEGRVLIFDDSYVHKAWNRTDRVRVVLFVDFVRPLRFPANLVNWLLLSLAPFTPFIREGCENYRKWANRFHERGSGTASATRISTL